MICPICGVNPLSNPQRNKECRDCWLKRHPLRTCERCGNPLPPGSRSITKRHRQCTITRPRVPCIDCGKLLVADKRGSKGRCLDCYQAFRKQRHEAARCEAPDCANEFYAKGLCQVHYTMKYFAGPQPGTKAYRPKAWVAAQPCQLCGFSEIKSHVHRSPIAGADGGKYVIGNMVALCANCHALVHRGLRTCPEPLSPT